MVYLYIHSYANLHSPSPVYTTFYLMPIQGPWGYVRGCSIVGPECRYGSNAHLTFHTHTPTPLHPLYTPHTTHHIPHTTHHTPHTTHNTQAYMQKVFDHLGVATPAHWDSILIDKVMNHIEIYTALLLYPLYHLHLYHLYHLYHLFHT